MPPRRFLFHCFNHKNNWPQRLQCRLRPTASLDLPNPTHRFLPVESTNNDLARTLDLTPPARVPLPATVLETRDATKTAEARTDLVRDVDNSRESATTVGLRATLHVSAHTSPAGGLVAPSVVRSPMVSAFVRNGVSTSVATAVNGLNVASVAIPVDIHHDVRARFPDILVTPHHGRIEPYLLVTVPVREKSPGSKWGK